MHNTENDIRVVAVIDKMYRFTVINFSPNDSIKECSSEVSKLPESSVSNFLNVFFAIASCCFNGFGRQLTLLSHHVIHSSTEICPESSASIFMRAAEGKLG